MPRPPYRRRRPALLAQHSPAICKATTASCGSWAHAISGMSPRSRTRHVGRFSHGTGRFRAFQYPIKRGGITAWAASSIGRLTCGINHMDRRARPVFAFFRAMHAQTRTVFCDPNRLFLGPYGKKSRIRTTDLLQKTSLSYRRSCFFGRFFRRSYVWGGRWAPKPGQQMMVHRVCRRVAFWPLSI